MILTEENQIWLRWLISKRKNTPVLLIEIRSGQIIAKLILINGGNPKTITSKSKGSLNDVITDVKAKFAFYNLEKAIWEHRPKA